MLVDKKGGSEEIEGHARYQRTRIPAQPENEGSWNLLAANEEGEPNMLLVLQIGEEKGKEESRGMSFKYFVIFTPSFSLPCFNYNFVLNTILQCDLLNYFLIL